jgi:hypothetical protein
MLMVEIAIGIFVGCFMWKHREGVFESAVGLAVLVSVVVALPPLTYATAHVLNLTGAPAPVLILLTIAGIGLHQYQINRPDRH